MAEAGATSDEVEMEGPCAADLALVGCWLVDRFHLRKLLGVGTHGAVYEAWDEQYRRAIALKTLRRVDPEDLYRFKREFRTLSDVSHPNLVTLYELFVEEGLAFFTMDLVEGVPFSAWVRPRGETNEGRLRDALRQLATGLAALHRFGRLHCDLKPSNVLVEPSGKVVLADFGLARELRTVEAAESELTGTPEYMSPEQAAAQELTAASDWYSVGVMLYEALAGTGPYPGLGGMSLLMIKQIGSIEPPSSRAEHVPADLERLCMALLARDPDLRPAEAEILERLGATPLEDAPPQGEETFFGRERELAQLGRALIKTRGVGREHPTAAVVFVRGPSGMGKTALLRRFFSNLRVSGEAVVLHGRCYEREFVPYKGLDVLVDALRRQLARAAGAGRPRPWPENIGALARLFPVLQDVPGMDPVEPSRTRDLVELRRRALEALRELLRGLAEEEAVVLHLDDAQWCDRDSGRLLVDLFRSSARPPVLFVASYRTEDAKRSDVLAELGARGRPAAEDLPLVELSIGPLSDEEAVELASAHLGLPQAHAMARAVAGESEGRPLFVIELARHLRSELEASDDPERLDPLRAVDLDAVISARADRLPSDALELLRVIVVAGRPIAQGLAIAAAQSQSRGLEALAALRSRGFVRTRGAGSFDTVEPYHDRIASAVLRGTSAEQLRGIHERLAKELDQAGAEPDVLAYHLEGAGRAEAAAEQYVRAASNAAQALAFDRATRSCRSALSLLPAEHPRRPAIKAALADALAGDGRGAEAGRAYLDAAAVAPASQALELRRRAADQLLRSGRVDEGLRELRWVLDQVGLALPSNPAQAFGSFLLRRAQIRLRGRRFVERTVEQVSPDLLLRIDTCWAAATGLISVNVVMGQAFQALHMLLALQAGEPGRVARALAMETLYAATSGEKGVAETRRVLAEVEQLASRLDDPRAMGVAAMAAGVADLYRGRFVEARPHLSQAEHLFRTRCANVAWELSMVRTWLVVVDYYLGDFEAMSQTMQESLEDAAARDDIHTALMLRVAYGPIEYLMVDDLEGARAEVLECQRRWPGELTGPTFRYVLMLTQARVERYAGNGARAWVPFVTHWWPMVRSLMLSKQPFRVFIHHDRACSALAAARVTTGRRRERLLSIARADARRLNSEDVEWSVAFAKPIEAALAVLDARPEQARVHLEAALSAFERSQMRMYAAAVRRRLGELTGDATLLDEGERAMAQQGVEDPARMTDLLVPAVSPMDP